MTALFTSLPRPIPLDRCLDYLAAIRLMCDSGPSPQCVGCNPGDRAAPLRNLNLRLYIPYVYTWPPSNAFKVSGYQCEFRVPGLFIGICLKTHRVLRRGCLSRPSHQFSTPKTRHVAQTCSSPTFSSRLPIPVPCSPGSTASEYKLQLSFLKSPLSDGGRYRSAISACFGKS